MWYAGAAALYTGAHQHNGTKVTDALAAGREFNADSAHAGSANATASAVVDTSAADAPCGSISDTGAALESRELFVKS